MTPAQAMRLQALKARLFDDLLFATKDFEYDEEINGANFVEGFARFRETAVKRIREAEGTHIVLFRDDSLKAADPPMIFMCEAEDSDHAEEQCLNAYPDCDVVWVYLGSDRDAAYDDYWENDNENQ